MSSPTNKNKSIQQLVAGVSSNNLDMQHECMITINEMLSVEVELSNDEVTSVIPRCVEFLNNDQSPSLQLEAVKLLSAVAATEHTEAIVHADLIPAFVKLLESESVDVREYALSGLTSIAADSLSYKYMVLGHGTLPALLKQFDGSSRLSMLQTAAWAISTLCNSDPPTDFSVMCQALPKLGMLILSKDEEVLSDTCWAFGFLTSGPDLSEQQVQAVLQACKPQRFVELLKHPELEVQKASLRTILNIIKRHDLNMNKAFVQIGVLDGLVSLFSADMLCMRIEACYTIAMIAMEGDNDQIAALIDSNIVPVLVEMMQKEEVGIRREAGFVIATAAEIATAEQIEYFVRCGCIKPLCDLLTIPNILTYNVALLGLNRFLLAGDKEAKLMNTKNALAQQIEEAGAIPKIIELQKHDNKDVSFQAKDFLQCYRGNEDGEFGITAKVGVLNLNSAPGDN